MSEMSVVKVDASAEIGTALIASDNSVWIPLQPKLWDLATWFWWWLCPSDKKAWISITNSHGIKVNVRAIRIAKKHAHVRGKVK